MKKLMMALASLPLATLSVVSFAAAQSAPPLLAYPNRAELEVLIPAESGALDAGPGLRLVVQRRLSLRGSLSASALRFTDPLARVYGATVGGGLAFPAREGRVLLEPFAEVGGGWIDGRIDNRGYDIVDDAGRTIRIPRYSAVSEPGVGGGAGLSVTGILGGQVAVRVSAAYWRFQGREATADGVRIGVGLGLTRADRRWFTLKSDRTPPRLWVNGTEAPLGDSIVLSDTVLTVRASDPNGIASVTLNRATLPTKAAAVGDDGTVVEGRVFLHVPLEGLTLTFGASDRAGQHRWASTVVYGPPDHAPPTVRMVDRAGAEGPTAWFDVVAVASDQSGIAAATVDGCPLSLRIADPELAQTLRLPVGAVIVSGGVPRSREAASLVVTDRAGNTTMTRIPIDSTASATEGISPTVDDATAVVTSAAGDRRGIRVRGVADHPSGVVRVTVDGADALLYSRGGFLFFDGWLDARADVRSVRVVATAQSGEESRVDVPVTGSPTAGVGDRFRVVTIIADPTAAQRARPALTADPSLQWEDRLATRPLNGRTVLDGLTDMAGAFDDSVAVLVHVDASLTALSQGGVSRPALQLDADPLELGRLGRAIRRLGAGTVIVSAALEPGRFWRPAPTVSPGGRSPAGCIDDADPPAGGLLDVGATGLAPVLRALAGAADLDADGVVTATELVTHLGLDPPTGLLPYDPWRSLSKGVSP